MKFWVLGLVVTVAVRAVPVEKVERAACTSPLRRKAWHALTRDEKLSYINAEKCLMGLPAKLGLPNARNRFDEFQMMHVMETIVVHGVGAFLPFHRFYVHAHETALRTECNYTGAQPYWDEALDAGNFSTSIVLDPETGFGGNGIGKNNCIADGPFKDYVNVIGPGQVNTNHCIDRQIDDCSSKSAAKENVDACMTKTTFVDVWNCLEGLPHAAGHGGIGGQMLNVFSSPGDPIFYLHHAYIDKLWWDWQTQNLTTRLSEIGGQNTQSFFGGFPGFGGNGTFPPFGGPNSTIPGGPNGTIPGFPGNATCGGFGGFPGGFPTGPPSSTANVATVQMVSSDGDPGNVTTLGHVLTVHGYLPNATVGDVMNIQSGLLCYEYI